MLKWFSYTGQDANFPPDATLEQIADQVRGQLTAIFQTLCAGPILVVLDDVWEMQESLYAALYDRALIHRDKDLSSDATAWQRKTKNNYAYLPVSPLLSDNNAIC